MSSGTTCAVVGCHNNSRKRKDFSETSCVEHEQLRQTCLCPAPYALHAIPRKEERRLAWLVALRLKYPPKRVFVCSFHFVDKKPTELHPDPELYLGYNRPPPLKRRKSHRWHNASFESLKAEGVIIPCDDSPVRKPLFPVKKIRDKNQPTEWRFDKMTQCDEIGYFMLQNDADALLYNGITLETFNTLVSTLEGYASNSFKMSLQDQVLMTLMKLKTNHVVGDLSRQFHTSQSMASKIILHWIDKLEEVLRPLIPWLPRETIQATMPAAFKKNFPNTTCIVDCSESLLQKTQNLDSRGESYSHYYSHNTVKYLVAVAPCGLIKFISAAYGGRCSDKFITMDSGLLDYLMPGDEVMADRGFTINDLLFERKVKLVMPCFTRKRGQLTEEQVTSTRRIAHVRIHVERAIRRLKVYKILSQVVPITMAPKIDKILRICASLVNLRADLIRDS
uniref:THAP-type domain-containing protein n=1 Tax=Sparus aurata TaxID=8175 RepID=A0A671YJ76_SPAAU